jgi:hypothetical protein
MKEIETATSYSNKWLQINRPNPFIDNKIENLIKDTIKGKILVDSSDQVYENFKIEMEEYITSSPLNNLKQIKDWVRKDICIGCTHFIDSIYMRTSPQILRGDYRYHERLNPNIIYSQPKNLVKNTPLIIAMPFPSTGDVHYQMNEILDECIEKNIEVHIDGAWITCCKGIDFDFSHPAIESIAISLSKGLGLGWNRIGLRWSKSTKPDSISIMNDYNMNLRAIANIGLYFLRNIPIDHLWLTHSNNYYKICKDFNLTPTKSIYIALNNGNPVGISPLLRYLEKNGNL